MKRIFLLYGHYNEKSFNAAIRDTFIETAEANGIKFQYYKSMGGTDAAKIQLAGDGVLVATIGMPARYIHSTTSMISSDDYVEVKKMVYTIIKMINTSLVEEIRSNV